MIFGSFVIAGLAASGSAQAQVLGCEITSQSDIETAKIQYLSEGLRISGYIMRDRTPDRRLPVLVFNRGGNRTFGAIARPLLNFMARFARSGFLVLASQYRGGPESDPGDEFGGDDVKDVLNLAGLAKELPYADSRNIFVYGHSRGGMMTYRALADSRMFRAGVVAAGVSDLRLSAKNRADMARLFRILVGPEGPAWTARSAVAWADKTSAPVLLFHARDDERVSFEHATRMVEALKTAGKPHRFVSFGSGGHGLRSRGDEVLDETTKWFKQHGSLAGSPASIDPPPETICDSFEVVAVSTNEGTAPGNLSDAIRDGNTAAFSALIAGGSSVNKPINFSHPRFAGGRELSRPPIVAAALFRRPAMAKILLEKGASVDGSAASALCAAIIMDQPEIIRGLIKAGLDAKSYRGCGRNGTMPALLLAKRFGKTEIANIIRRGP